MARKKRRHFQEICLYYRQIVILLVCCLVVLGIFGLKMINKNEFPDYTVREGIVAAVFPGATSEEVEQEVTKPLENYIFSYKEVLKEKTYSYSRDGMSIIVVELNENLEDKDEFWSKFKHGVATFKSSLPRGVVAVRVQDDFGDVSSELISLESKDKTYRELNEYMKIIKDSLRMVPSVGKMSVTGMQMPQIAIYLDTDKPLPVRHQLSGHRAGARRKGLYQHGRKPAGQEIQESHLRRREPQQNLRCGERGGLQRPARQHRPTERCGGGEVRISHARRVYHRQRHQGTAALREQQAGHGRLAHGHGHQRQARPHQGRACRPT